MNITLKCWEIHQEGTINSPLSLLYFLHDTFDIKFLNSNLNFLYSYIVIILTNPTQAHMYIWIILRKLKQPHSPTYISLKEEGGQQHFEPSFEKLYIYIYQM